jgi:hypothetical protein
LVGIQIQTWPVFNGPKHLCQVSKQLLNWFLIYHLDSVRRRKGRWTLRVWDGRPLNWSEGITKYPNTYMSGYRKIQHRCMNGHFKRRKYISIYVSQVK